MYQDAIRKRLEPFNFGQSKSGMETFISAIRYAQNGRPQQVIVKIDSTNAFHTLSRKTMFEQIAKYFPSLMPYLNAIYGCPRQCWTPSPGGPCELIMSHEGVTQGHIWGSALFNLGTLEPIFLTLNKYILRARHVHPLFRHRRRDRIGCLNFFR